jgi:hypothetical protein
VELLLHCEQLHLIILSSPFDLRYQLNTEAGFLIGRKAVLSLTNVGEGQLQGLVATTIDKRWKQLEGTLRDVAGSFRVNKLNSGIFSSM